MTQADNFTTNPTRPDIELSIFLDSDSARWRFEEDFEVIDHKENLWLFTADGQLPDEHRLISIPARFNTKNNVAAALDELSGSFYSYLDDVQDYTLRELISDLEDRATFDDDYVNTLDDYNIVYNQSYDIISVTGCNQGDYATVIVPTDKLAELWGNKPDLSKLRTHFEHLFYDAPLYCKIAIDNIDYYLEDFWFAADRSEYDYDKDDFIAAFMAAYDGSDREYVQEFLDEHLPEYPEYV